MRSGWYWYRSTAKHDPASGGDWVVLYVDGNGAAEVADVSVGVEDLHGEWRGPISEPDDDPPVQP